MRRILFLSLITATIFACSPKEQQPTETGLQAFADSIFKADIDSSFIAGASVLVAQHGKLLLDKSYGLASIELGVPIPADASFEIGSVTKQFTAAAILKLNQEGKLSLNDDITKYLDFDTKGRKVTINNLLYHTSGIPGYTELPEFGDLSIEQHERDTLLRVVEKHDFLFEPGEAMIYCNTGYFLLGLIIEKISEMSYEDYLNEAFFVPLGMDHSYYCSISEPVTGKVYGYSYSPKGLVQKPYLDHTWPYAAGSLCSTKEDLLTWLEALHGGGVLDESGYELMTTPGTLNDGTPLRYAMGLEHFKLSGNEMIAHAGGINGFLTETRYFPGANLYVVCLVNTTGPKGAGYFADQLTWKLLDKSQPEAMDKAVDLQHYTGKYSGPVRGREVTLDIEALENGFTLLPEGSEVPDTITTYLGNNAWAEGSAIYTFTDDKLKIDMVYGYYILHKL
ncbi:serine hydrolase domain-containing protein [Maribellus mangrovi]|uniref:serine hydrolase domain-containing protein n=1 Tax=Maribellus mangrovi TaxID=3133146 RepID=UPI0030EC8B7F